MPFGDKGVLETVVEKLATFESRADQKAKAVSDALGEKLFGPTAESEYAKAETIKPEASGAPTTYGRRSKGPDGQDPFHATSSASETLSEEADKA